MSEFIKNYINDCSLYMNPEDKWLWLRIHKTAGTSIYDYLKEHCNNNPKHGFIKAIEWARSITDQDLKEYFIWSCVRNPYDRFNSTAAMFNIDPNDFAKYFHLFKQINIIGRHSKPQYLFTHFEGKQVPNTIIRFENLTEGFKMICNKLGLPECELPRLNSTKHGHWKDDLNEETITFVNNYYTKDFEYFNYEKL